MVREQIIQKYTAHSNSDIVFLDCLRKKAYGEVTVRSPGTGLITINKQSIEYFEHIQDREQVGCATFYMLLSLLKYADSVRLSTFVRNRNLLF
jgi:ribosomal protein S9